MLKRIIPVVLCALFVIMTIPVVGESESVNNVDEKTFKIFLKCYIETTVYGEFEPTEKHPELGLGLFFPYGENAKTTIFSEKGGDILLHHAGRHRLRIALFIGHEEVTENTAILNGKAFFISFIGI
jgi:hypothetical protein